MADNVTTPANLPAPVVAAAPAAVKQTVVEEGTEIEGTVRSKCPIKVSGLVKGDLSAPSLNVTATGSVKGQVKVKELHSEGEIAGSIDAESVQLSGKVSDNTAIRATTLEVKLAQSDGKLQVTFGNVELNVGERPAKTETKEPAHADGERKNQGGQQRAEKSAEKR
jgi:cytoskeletal protein CcmA (bactofilin family)